MRDDALYNQVIQSMERYSYILYKMGLIEQAKLLDGKIDEYKQGLFQILIVGGFATGKSTLLNSLCRRQLVRTSIDPEGDVPIRIINGKNNNHVVVTYLDSAKADNVMEYEKYREEYCSWKNDNFRRIAYLTMENEMPDSRVSYVDTPGNSIINSIINDHLVLDMFLDKSDAIVMVLSALELGTAKERTYIQTRFAGRSLDNVFFVVNRVNQITCDSMELLNERVQELLKCVFTNTEGNFDEDLYKKRVFCIDAYTSLCARTGKMKEERKGIKFVKIPVLPEEDEMTGVPEFERALMEYVDTLEREKDLFRSSLPQLAAYYVHAKNNYHPCKDLYKEQRKLDTDVKNLEWGFQKESGALSDSFYLALQKKQELADYIRQYEEKHLLEISRFENLLEQLLKEFNVLSELIQGRQYNENEFMEYWMKQKSYVD